MPKRGNRINFSKKTIEECAKRVGFICSNPDCRNFTIGPSSTRKSGVNNIGKASHICAAAPGGPRFDKNLSDKQIESLDNCIWLCQSCGTLIDNDPGHYTVEILNKWKLDAEKKAEEFIASNRLFSSFLKDKSKISSLKSFLDDLLAKGNYDSFIRFYSWIANDPAFQNNPIVLLEKLKFDFQCRLSDVKNDALLLAKTKNEVLCNEGLESAVSFFNCEACQELIKYANNEKLSNLASFVSLNKIEDVAGASNNPIFSTLRTDLKLKEILFKAATVANTELNYQLKYSKGFENCFEGEVFFRLIVSACRILLKCLPSPLKESGDNNDLRYLLDHLREISYLDVHFQKNIYKAICMLSMKNEKQWYHIFENITELSKQDADICGILYSTMPKEMIAAIEPNKICFGNFGIYHFDVIQRYLRSVSSQNAVSFLNTYHQLFTEYPILILYYLDLKPVLDGDRQDYILLLNERYRGDVRAPMYIAIKDFLLFKKERKKASLDDLNAIFEYSLKTSSLIEVALIASVFHDSEDYLRLLELSNRFPDLPEFQILVGKFLLDSSDNSTIRKAKAILLKEEEFVFAQNDDDLRFSYYECLVRICLKLKDYENLRQYSSKAFEISKNTKMGELAVQAQLEINDIKLDAIDEEMAKVSNNSSCIYALASLYSSNNRFEEAKNLLLRSYLLDTKNYSALSDLFCGLLTGNLPTSDPSDSRPLSVIFLSFGGSARQVALLPKYFLNGPTTRQLFGADIFSVEDHSELLFFKKGDDILIDNKKWHVEKISSIWEFIRASSAIILEKLGTVKSFEIGEKGHELDPLIEALKQYPSATNEIFEKYHESNTGFPLSSMRSITGRSVIKVLEELFFNPSFARKTYDYKFLNRNQKLFLAADTLFLLAYIGVNPSDLPTGCFIPAITKRVMRLDAQREIQMDEMGKSPGSLILKDNKPFILKRTAEQRREERRILNGLINLLDQVPVISCAKALDDQSNHVPQLFLENPEYALEKDALANAFEGSLVSEDKFMLSCCLSLKINLIGIISFICEMNISPIRKLEFLEKLSDTNLCLYCSQRIFSDIRSEAIGSSDESSELREAFKSFVLGNWKKMDEKEKIGICK